MTDKTDEDIKDYKIYSFDGVPKVIQVDFDRFTGTHGHNYYTTDWEYRDIQVLCDSNPLKQIERPQKLEEMLSLSSEMSKGIPQVRTDFYYINEQIYFGELTFYSNNGIAKFAQEEFAYELGSYIHLPQK